MSYLKALLICQAAFLMLVKAQNEQPLLAPTSLNSQYAQPEAFRHAACPQYDDVAHPVQLTYPYDCSKYYSCVGGFAYLLSCPVGLQWSSLTYRCDYPAVANCQPVARPAPPNAPNYALPGFKYLPYAGDCSKYLQCQVLQCPPPSLWNANSQRCDPPALATCPTYQQPPLLAPITPTYVPPITPRPPFVPPTAATPPPPSMSVPWPHVPNKMPWPVNPLLENYTSIPADNYGPNEIELNQLCSQTEAEYIHYPGDCHRFIQCNGIAYVQTCPSNLYWNSELLTCHRHCK